MVTENDERCSYRIERVDGSVIQRAPRLIGQPVMMNDLTKRAYPVPETVVATAEVYTGPVVEPRTVTYPILQSRRMRRLRRET